MVRGAHHDAVFIGQTRALGIVVVEGVVPHRRPEEVAAQSQDQLEDVHVHLAVDAAELLLRPTGERRRLVVEEDAAVFHRRAIVDQSHRTHVDGVAMHSRHVGPPVPGRHADLLRQLVDAVDRAALVAAGDDQRALDARQRPLDRLEQERLPASRDPGDVDLAGLGQPVDERTAPDRAHDHDKLGRRAVGRSHHRLQAGDPLDIGLQIAHRPPHPRPIGRVDEQRRSRATGHERSGLRVRGKSDEALLPEREAKQREGGEHQGAERSERGSAERNGGIVHLGKTLGIVSESGWGPGGNPPRPEPGTVDRAKQSRHPREARPSAKSSVIVQWAHPPSPHSAATARRDRPHGAALLAGAGPGSSGPEIFRSALSAACPTLPRR